MKKRTLLIEIDLDGSVKGSDLYLRQILVGTLEGRGWANVIEETSSLKLLEVVIETVLGNENDIANLLTSLGFNRFYIRDITIND